MSVESAHDVIVLAAGGSRRLGQPKQLLYRQGVSLLQQTVRLAWATRPQRVVVVLGAEAASLRLHAETAKEATEIVINEAWASGMASSLRVAAGVLGLSHRRTMILGCDQPALAADHLRRLIELADDARSGCSACAHQGRPGIPALLPAALFAEHQRLQDDQGFGSLLRQWPDDAIGLLEAPELQFDIDTPADLAQARATGLVDDA